MKAVDIRFYEELNDFLPPHRRKVDFSWMYRGSPTVKFAIEALGVPHVEVDLILVNGRPVTFEHVLHDGDRISVYPVFESLDISPVIRLREKPLREPKFLPDNHLGKLCRYLRMCGFDTFFRNDLSDPEIIKVAKAENRIILTRDRELLKSKSVTRGYWVRSQHPREQLEEVVKRLDLKNSLKPFTRCLDCNNPVFRVSREDIATGLLPGTLELYDEFQKCNGCGKIYWKGTHWKRMDEMIKKLAQAEEGLAGHASHAGLPCCDGRLR